MRMRMRMRDRGSLRGILMILWLGSWCGLAACDKDALKNHDAAPEDGPVTPDSPSTDDGRPIDAPGDGGSIDGPIDGRGPFGCDPIQQVGCNVGEKCDIAATGTFGCVPDGNLGDFRACGAKDEPNSCVSGFTCSGTFSAANRCTKLCSQLDNRCLREERCETSHTTSDSKQYLTCTTHEACNPLLDDCAEPNTHCTYLVVQSACLDTGTVADGQVCQIRQGNVQDCTAGSACVNVGPGAVFKCVKMCDPAPGSTACAGGATCNPLAMVGPQNVGWCALP